ncbi:MAG: acetate--CoA ligase family protein [Lautropia sp.]
MNPENDASARRLAALLSPATVAIVGASDDPRRIGGRPIDYMRSQGYGGRILPVNPNRDRVQGIEAYASIDALPVAPDVAIVAVAAAGVAEAIEALGRRGTGTAIVFSAGFAETGPAGAALQAGIVSTARRHGMRLLGPNTLGLLNPGNGFYGSFISSVELGFPAPGGVGIASQSGAYGGHLLGLARRRGMGLSACVMTGNEADLTLGDAMLMYVEDPDTHVIVAYAEGVRDGERFVAALDAARCAGKPVVVMKVGTSDLGRTAAQSHTASLAGDDAVFDAVLAEFGAHRARTTEELLDVAQLATRRIYPVSNTLGVITVSGGAGVLVSDAASLEALPMPPMPEAAQRRLLDAVPFCAPRNPVDCTAQFQNDLSLVGRFVEALVQDGGYRSVLAFFTYTAGAASVAPRLRQELRAIRERHPDRLYVLVALASPDQVRDYEADGLTVFEDPTRAVVAIAAMGRFGDAFEAARRRSATVPVPAPAAAPPPSPAAALPALPYRAPNEVAAKALLARAGIAVAPERLCTSPDDAVAAADALGIAAGQPVVMKIVSPDILHKTEIGGVVLDVRDASAVRRHFDALRERAAQAAPAARIDGVLVARQLHGGIECIVGVRRDPVFGPMAMFGLGGVFVETLGDVVLRRCPFDVAAAREMIAGIRGAALLQGARGRPAVDIAALATMLSRVSVFAAAAGPRLVSIDLNPVLAMPAGEGAFALDAVIEVDTSG